MKTIFMTQQQQIVQETSNNISETYRIETQKTHPYSITHKQILGRIFSHDLHKIILNNCTYSYYSIFNDDNTITQSLFHTFIQGLQKQKKHRKKTRKIILGTLFVIGLMIGAIPTTFAQNQDIYMVATEANITKKQLADIEKQRDEVSNISHYDDKYFQTTNHEILKVLHEGYKQIDTINHDIRQYYIVKKQGEVNNQKINDLKQQTKETKKEIIHLTNILYQLQNEFMDHGIVQDIKLLFKTDKGNTIGAQQGYINILIDQLNTLLSIAQQQQEQYRDSLKSIYSNKKQLTSTITSYHDTLKGIQQEAEHINRFIDLYKNNEQQITENMNTLFANRKEIEAEIKTVSTLLQKGDFFPDWDYDSSKEKLLMLHERGNKNTYQLSRPVLPVKKINIYFHDNSYYEKYQQNYPGINIQTAQGNTVYASDDAIVIKASNSNLGINWLLLEHPNNTLTAYLYLKDIVVYPGDIIRRGQVIAYSDGEIGSNKAGFTSAGPNLTFITYDNGFIDPLTLLDLGVINDIRDIPPILARKQKNDMQLRPINLNSVEFMSGSTLQEREQQFLNLYAKGIYADLSLWKVAGADHNIDTTFAICIGFAESTLGNHLTTDSNIGNVGNFDDPNIRTSLNTPLAGIQAIYDTLDNQLLGDYNRIDELSGYGNKNTGAIYASSPYNRQNNVLKCLSMIHGYYVPEDYPFRTGPRTHITSSFQAGGELGVN